MCVLGPTLFVILLEFCLRMADLEGIGVEFVCGVTKHLTCPPELLGQRFRLRRGEFADDVFIVGLCPRKLSQALSSIQKVTGEIGLDVSVAKAEWMFLHNPAREEMLQCRARRREGNGGYCCEEVTLDGERVRHVSSFRYLGSVMSEEGGVELDTAAKIRVASAALNRLDWVCLGGPGMSLLECLYGMCFRYGGLWASTLPMRTKCRYLGSHVLPSLLYAAECGNHRQNQYKELAVFLNTCRRRLLGGGGPYHGVT